MKEEAYSSFLVVKFCWLEVAILNGSDIFAAGLDEMLILQFFLLMSEGLIGIVQ